MSQSCFELTVLGARGSMACARPACALFGGDTSCYRVRAGEETIFLDAGSGLLGAAAAYSKPPVILLSHLHLDHLIGLGMFPGLSVPGQGLRVYVPFCESREAAERTMNRIYDTPLWPVRLSQAECGAELLPLPETLTLGGVTVTSMPGSHPNGCLVFRLRYEGKSLVYATDFEHEERSFTRLAAFARGTDLLLYDAQFTPEEYASRKGFGHSTAEQGVELWKESGAKRLLLIHHAPWSTDTMLLAREKGLPEGCAYAREGQILSL